MGDFIITVHGTSSHHNSQNQKDADRMARRFAEDLVNAGHHIKHAEIRTFGSTGRRQHLLTGDDIPEPVPAGAQVQSPPTGPGTPNPATAPGSVAQPTQAGTGDPSGTPGSVPSPAPPSDPKAS